MLMESITLTGKEVKLIFCFQLLKDRSRIAVPPEAIVCLMYDVEKDFQIFYFYSSGKTSNETVACAR